MDNMRCPYALFVCVYWASFVPQSKTACLSLLFLVRFVTECKDYCHNHDFTAECPTPGEVILMETARYGRMKFGQCVREGFGYVGCSVDVIENAHERCSGRKTCVIRVPDATLDLRRPCNDDLKSYLETTYTCISGQLTNDVVWRLHQNKRLPLR